MRTSLSLIGGFVALALCANFALGHGGTYTGPSGGGTPGYNGPVGGGTLGPQPGNPTPGGPGGGVTPGSGGGGTTGPTPGGPAPVRPGGRGGAPARGGTTGQKKGGGDTRFLDWDWWWDLNDDRYLNLKNKVRTLETGSTNADTFIGESAPAETVAQVTKREIASLIIPSLKVGIKDSFFDARAGAVIALGKVSDPANAENLQSIRALLADKDKTVSESACLALGILGNKEAVPDLLEVAKNTAKGRKLVGAETGDVPTRTRTFAAVGLGLIGWRESYKPEDGVVKELMTLVTTKNPDNDVNVGAAIALQLTKSQEAVPQMIDIFKDQEADKHVRAHIGVALGKCGAKQAIGELLKGLEDKENYVSYASAISLGLLVSKEDRDAVNKVIKYADSAADRGTKNFCLIALGEIGDPKGQALLLQKVKNGQIADATFAALALGVMGNKFPNEAAQAGPMLLDVYKESKDMKKAAVAIGLALCNFTNASETMRKDLADAGGGNQELKGHLCTALGLLGDRDSVPVIRELVKQKGDQDLRRRAAIALGLLKDPDSVEVLKKVIEESSASKAILGEATKALGFVGDRKAVPVLVDMVENKKNEHLDVTRAFATVALGLLGDKDDIPLLSRIHENSNYLAQTGSLAELLTIL